MFFNIHIDISEIKFCQKISFQITGLKFQYRHYHHKEAGFPWSKLKYLCMSISKINKTQLTGITSCIVQYDALKGGPVTEENNDAVVGEGVYLISCRYRKTELSRSRITPFPP